MSPTPIGDPALQGDDDAFDQVADESQPDSSAPIDSLTPEQQQQVEARPPPREPSREERALQEEEDIRMAMELQSQSVVITGKLLAPVN